MYYSDRNNIIQKLLLSVDYFAYATGSLTFTHAIKLFEKEDEEIASMAADLKTKFIPPLPHPPLFIPRDVT